MLSNRAQFSDRDRFPIGYRFQQKQQQPESVLQPQQNEFQFVCFRVLSIQIRSRLNPAVVSDQKQIRHNHSCIALVK